MTVKLKTQMKPASEAEVIGFEQQIGFSIPTDYRLFLKQNNGAIPETNEFDLPSDGGSGVNEFLSLTAIVETKSRMGDRFLPLAWPIAFAEGGNYVCLVTGDNPGIYFWDHEFESEEDEPATWDNMIRLADCFDSFFSMLRKLDVSSIELKPDQVQSTWINPDFKPEF